MSHTAGHSDAQAARARAGADVPDGLPIPRNPLFGRGSELEDIATLLGDAGTRLVTLVGPPGIGKTRLALAAAHRLRAQFPDGVWLVPLAPLGSAEHVAGAAAVALGLRRDPGQPADAALRLALRARRTLLLLDNFEHLLPAAGLVASLLESCRELRVLATSREALRLPFERAYPVLALPTPAAHAPGAGAAEAQVALRSPAVRMFLARMPQGAPADPAVVGAICRRLDGLPLAIELAAAHTPLLPPDEILAHLTRALDTSSRQPHRVPARQRTLRGAIAWSYDLLAEPERRALSWLSVLPAGVAAADSAALSASAPAEALEALARKSLLQREPARSGDRLTLLAVVREFALGRLRTSGEERAARAAAAAYLAGLAERAEGERHRPARRAWLERLDAEHDNLRAALAWCCDQAAGPGGTAGADGGSLDRAETALRLAAALSWFWAARGHAAEGRAWGERALAAAQGAPARVWARLLSGLGTLCRHLDDQAAASSYLEHSLLLFRSAGDRSGEGWALHELGLARADRGEDAGDMFAASLALHRAAGDAAGTGAALNDLGRTLAQRGAYAEGRAALAEAVELLRAHADDASLAWALFNAGQAADDAGEPAAADAPLSESLALFQCLGERAGAAWVTLARGVAALHRGAAAEAAEHAAAAVALHRALEGHGGTVWALLHLARAELLRGRRESARERAREAQCLALAAGVPQPVAYLLEISAGIALDEGSAERAARLLGAADALRGRSGAPRSTPDAAWHAAQLGRLTQALGADGLAAGLAAGGLLEPAAALDA